MTPCPDTGALRAALDDERPDVAAHVAGCSACAAITAELTDNSGFTAAALVPPSFDVDVDAGLKGISARMAPTVVPLESRRRRPAPRLGRVAAVLVGVVVVAAVLATPGGRNATASLLERFRAERVAVVPVDFSTVDVAALKSLAQATNIDVDRLADPERVPDLAAAADVAGFSATPLDRDSLADSVTGPMMILAQRPQTVRVTFDRNADVPAAVRDAVLVVDVPGAVVQVVGGGDDVPALIRGEAGELQVTVEGGPTLAQVREALLAQPGLPPETVAALRDIEEWETTVPLPIPSDAIAWEETTVSGKPALAFGDESGLVSALLWNDGERFIGVGGRLPLSEVRRLAETP